MGIIYTFFGGRLSFVHTYTAAIMYILFSVATNILYILSSGHFRTIAERNGLQSLIQYLLQVGVVETHFI